MRNITFAKKDFAAVHSMNIAEKKAINQLCSERIKALGLKPERRRHSIQFSSADLYIGEAGTPITHTTSVSDIRRFIQNVEVVSDKADAEQVAISREACETLCKLYLLTR